MMLNADSINKSIEQMIHSAINNGETVTELQVSKDWLFILLGSGNWNNGKLPALSVKDKVITFHTKDHSVRLVGMNDEGA